MLGELVFANDTLNNPLAPQFFAGVFKWDANGTRLWARSLYGLPGAPQLNDMATNAQGDLLVSSSHYFDNLYLDSDSVFPGENNAFLLKLRPNGQLAWYKTEATQRPCRGLGVAVFGGNEYRWGGSTGTPGTYQFGCLDYATDMGSNFLMSIKDGTETLPIAGFGYSSSGNTWTFTDASVNADTWHWSFGDGDTSEVPSPVHTFTGAGNYTVVLTVSHGACTDTDTLQIISDGVPEPSGPIAASIHPNPANDQLFVEGMLGPMEITIHDITGKTVMRARTGGSRVMIDVSSVGGGPYTVILRSSEGVVLRKELLVIH